MSEELQSIQEEDPEELLQTQSEQVCNTPLTQTLYIKENYAECSTSAPSICQSCVDSEVEKRVAASRRAKAVIGNSRPSTSAGIPVLTRLVSRQKHAFTLGRYPGVLRAAPSFAQLTKRPLNCHATNCQKVFACNQIINHVYYEHSKTPSEIINFYQEKIVDVNPAVLVANETVVLAMLVIPREFIPPPVNQQLDNSFVYLVFGTRQPLPTSTLVSIWVSGYMEEFFTCTLELYSGDRSSSYAYHGGINSLRDSNKTIDIFNRAQCLLIKSCSFDKMISQETGTLKLKVSISCKHDDGQ